MSLFDENSHREQEQSFEGVDSEEQVPPTDIVAYNELRSCADLYRLHSSGKLEVQPDFQREVVWRQAEQTRFIDSLVKQLPIPSMCFSLDYRTQKWKVIDGLQRMTSIIKFLSGTNWMLTDLEDIHPRLRGVSVQALRDGDEVQKRLYSSVEDVSIPVTVIRCDYAVESHMRYLFTIFHRLNSGGVRLNNQEIRNCIFTGKLNDLMKKFDKENDDWSYVKRRIWGSVDRFRSVEVVLRTLSFGEELDKYDGNLAQFLNSFMGKNANASEDAVKRVNSVLVKTSSAAHRCLNDGSRGKLPLAFVEATLVGIYANLDRAYEAAAESLVAAGHKLREMPSFAEGARYAVSSADNVKARLNDAKAVFSEV